MKICIVGGGLLAYFLSRSLLSKGHSLTIVNDDREECAWFARRLKAVIVHGDGTQPAVLDDAGLTSMDSVLAITPHDEDNYLVCQAAQRKYGVSYAFALVNDPDNERIFRELGVFSAFSPIRILSALIEQRIGYDAVTNLTPLADGKANLTEITLPGDAPVVGKKILDIDLPEACLIVSVLREGQVLIPRGSTELRPQDRVGIVSLPEVYPRVLAALTGETGV
jgi:trk system potassium uptake protein TrkA